ncbi:hypothetical protein Hdeb2414_s0005g00161361 [Helianthus debilis subsp. tardiflorus]
MNKRSKKTTKSNINTRKGTKVACPTPRQHLRKQNKEDRRLNTPVLSEHGAVPKWQQKRQSHRSFCCPPRGRAQRTRGHGQLPADAFIGIANCN